MTIKIKIRLFKNYQNALSLNNSKEEGFFKLENLGKSSRYSLISKKYSNVTFVKYIFDKLINSDKLNIYPINQLFKTHCEHSSKRLSELGHN